MVEYISNISHILSPSCCLNLKSLKMCTVNVYGKTCMVTTGKKLGSTSSQYPAFYTSPTLNSTSKISPSLQTNSRSILLNWPMGKGPSSLELPIQLILQTGHRNAEAKTAPWTPNATQRLQVDLLLRLANLTDLVPIWHGAQPRRTRKPEIVYLFSPPLQFTKQQPKVWIDLDPSTTQPEGNSTPYSCNFYLKPVKTCMVKHIR